MTSTQNVEALELLSSGAPTIRCSWGLPSESGMATNVTIVDAEQSAAVAAALANAGFACADELGGTVCRFAQSMINQDDEIAELAETHVLARQRVGEQLHDQLRRSGIHRGCRGHALGLKPARFR